MDMSKISFKKAAYETQLKIVHNQLWDAEKFQTE
jgi:hypothetical protein